MKSLIAKWNALPRRSKSLAVMVVGTAGLLVTMGALNGGTAPTAGVWDGLKQYANDMLTSTFVIMLAFIALIICVWQIAHGRGFGHVGVVIGILAVALLGPSVVIAAATATRDPGAIFAFASADSAASNQVLIASNAPR
jgi:multisubunit Na+/H+ antiporter MnhG subunit